MKDGIDVYTRGVIRYPQGVCSFQLGMGVKTEGNLVIAGTKGYAYVPSTWWLTDYYDFRFEDQNQNKKLFYKWDDAGLRYEIQKFLSCIFTEPVTLRYHHKGLHHYIKSQLHRDPTNGDFYIFLSKVCKRIKNCKRNVQKYFHDILNHVVVTVKDELVSILPHKWVEPVTIPLVY